MRLTPRLAGLFCANISSRATHPLSYSSINQLFQFHTRGSYHRVYHSSTPTMTDQFAFSYPSPLEGYENLEPLSEERNEDGKSLKNPQHGVLSKAYEEFPDPLAKDRRGGFDIHIYHFQNNPDQVAYARALWERIRREFPELRIYTFWDKPVGPHPVAMFEVNLFTPAQFGAFIPWLVINRGPLSVLVHPNTLESEDEQNHTQRATWMGDRIPLDLRIFKLMKEAEKKKEEEAEKAKTGRL